MNSFEISIIQLFQSVGDGILQFMFLIDWLFEKPYLYVAIVLFIYWCIDIKMGIKLFVYLQISLILNNLLKIFIRQNRPFLLTDQIKDYYSGIDSKSFGMPSGHAQTTSAFFIPIAYYLKSKWVWIISVFIVLFVGFNRMYLGAHSALQVLAGWIVSILIFLLIERYENNIISFVKRTSKYLIILAIFIISLCSALMAYFNLMYYEKILTFEYIKNIIQGAGLFFGFLTGVLMIPNLNLNVKDSWKNRIIRYLLSLIIISSLLFLFGFLSPYIVDFYLLTVLNYLWYALIGFAASYITPKIFIKFKLLKQK